MSDNKYDKKLRKPSGSYRQRDMNPPDQPLKKSSTFQLKKQAQDLIEGRINKDQLSKEKVELLNKYATYVYRAAWSNTAFVNFDLLCFATSFSWSTSINPSSNS